ncbi:MAG: adenylate kinase [Clostridia bacterium]|jgi:adenylate kinases|nr:adenylate kinase [Clostridia bacterium]MBQ4452326.1 adenylate kinase [Clostridia bacterium]MBR5379152.1 adenylate kinase [Clostridia bacterium]
MKLVFLGPPGAGKGTQAQVICEKLSIPHISTGDMLRSAIANKTPTGLKAKAYVESGALVPDEVLIEMVRERLSNADCANGYLLDGFPRTVHQASALDEIQAPDLVIDVDVSDDMLLKRLTGRRVCTKCGGTFHISTLENENVCPVCGAPLIQRKDDTPETISNRLSVYHTQTAPLIDFYSAAGKLRRVDGAAQPGEVTNAILLALGC